MLGRKILKGEFYHKFWLLLKVFKNNFQIVVGLKCHLGWRMSELCILPYTLWSTCRRIILFSTRKSGSSPSGKWIVQYSQIVIEFGVFIVVHCAHLAGGTWTVSGLKNVTGEAPSFASPRLPLETHRPWVSSLFYFFAGRKLRVEALQPRFLDPCPALLTCSVSLGNLLVFLFSYPRVEIIIVSSA